MRTIRTRRIKTQNAGFSIGPFHESVVEIEIDKSKKCLLEIKNSIFAANIDHLQRANAILKQIQKDKNLVAFEHKIQIALRSLILLIKSYLCFKQSRPSQSLNHLREVEQSKYQCQRVNKLITPLSMLIRATIQSQIGNLDKSKGTMKDSLFYIKSIRNDDFLTNRPRSMKMYDEVLVVFFDMLIFEIGRNIAFQQIQAIYKEGFFLSQRILGKQHKLTILMQNFLQQKLQFFSKRTDLSSSKQKSLTIKVLNSKRRLKVNEQKLFSSLIQKSGQNNKKYNQELAIFNKLTNPNKASKKQYSYYLKSLEKVKQIYRTQTQSNAYSYMTSQGVEPSTKSKPLSRNEFSRKKIKDIILRGPKLKTQMLYSRQETENSEQIDEYYTPIEMSQVKKDEQKSGYIIIEKIQVVNKQQEIDLKQVAQILQDGQEKKRQDCQLI